MDEFPGSGGTAVPSGAVPDGPGDVGPATDRTSWMACLGGQGGAGGWSVRPAGGGRRITVPDATYGRSGRTVFALTWGDDPLPMHPLVGPRTGGGELGALEVDGQGVVIEHPVLREHVPDLPPGRYLLSYASFAADAVPFDGHHRADPGSGPDSDDHGSSVVTVRVHLRRASPPPRHRAVPAAGHLVARLDELGLVVADPPEADRILEIHRHEIARCGGLLEAMGTTYLGEALVDSGAFFPLWGMRPAVYRVATASPTAALCPIGEPAGTPVELCASPFSGGARLVPGSSLRGSRRVDWRRWPVLPLPGTGAGLRIQAFVGSGVEPLTYPLHAGIVATVWLERTPHAPPGANSARFPRPDFNPLEWVPAGAGPQVIRSSAAGQGSPR